MRVTSVQQPGHCYEGALGKDVAVGRVRAGKVHSTSSDVVSYSRPARLRIAKANLALDTKPPNFRNTFRDLVGARGTWHRLSGDRIIGVYNHVSPERNMTLLLGHLAATCLLSVLFLLFHSYFLSHLSSLLRSILSIPSISQKSQPGTRQPCGTGVVHFDLL